MALHWIFKSWRVQEFIIGCMEGFYEESVHDADKRVLLAYMERGDASGLTWDLEDRLDHISEAIGAVESMRMRETLEVLRRAIEKELRWRDVDEAEKEAARPRDVNDLWDEIEVVRARWDGEVCEVGQTVLDTVHTLQQAIGNWIDEGRETDMSIALTSAMAAMVMAVEHGNIRYGSGLAPKYRLKPFHVEAVTEAACELAKWRRADMRHWPQLGWTEDEIERLKWKMLEGIRPLSFYRSHAQPVSEHRSTCLRYVTS